MRIWRGGVVCVVSMVSLDHYFVYNPSSQGASLCVFICHIAPIAYTHNVIYIIYIGMHYPQNARIIIKKGDKRRMLYNYFFFFFFVLHYKHKEGEKECARMRNKPNILCFPADEWRVANIGFFCFCVHCVLELSISWAPARPGQAMPCHATWPARVNECAMHKIQVWLFRIEKEESNVCNEHIALSLIRILFLVLLLSFMLRIVV